MADHVRCSSDGSDARQRPVDPETREAAASRREMATKKRKDKQIGR